MVKGVEGGREGNKGIVWVERGDFKVRFGFRCLNKEYMKRRRYF